MSQIYSISNVFHPTPLIAQIGIVTMLVVTVTFFLILLVLGIRKSHKLTAENEKLSKKHKLDSDKIEKKYENLTQGHLYD